VTDLARQRFVIARLADFCDHRSQALREHREPAGYLLAKLAELQEPLRLLKQDVLRGAVDAFLAKLDGPGAASRDVDELGHVLDRLLSRGDFADAFFNLSEHALASDNGRAHARAFLLGLRAQDHLGEEEGAAAPDEAWEGLVREMHGRLKLDVLERCARRRPLDPRRRRFLLRRLRHSAADYCAVLRVPARAGEAFTPFMLPRVEALVEANRRFLRLLRRL
jgi:hypothetical protein